MFRILQRVVSWSALLAAREADSSADNSRGTAELCLGKPKSAQRKGRNLVIRVRVNRHLSYSLGRFSDVLGDGGICLRNHLALW